MTLSGAEVEETLTADQREAGGIRYKVITKRYGKNARMIPPATSSIGQPPTQSIDAESRFPDQF